jgi:hypothetical protein
MTPYELLYDIRKTIFQKHLLKKGPADLTKETITVAEHLEEINNVIAALKTALDVAEYEFKFLDTKSKLVTIESHQVNLKVLEENNTIVFQPLGLLDDECYIDMESLVEGMQQLAESTGANIIMVPPNVNVMVAKLKKTSDEGESNGQDIRNETVHPYDI